MAFRRRGSYRRNSGMGLRPVDSMKNVVYLEASTGTAATENIIALAVDTPTTAVANAVQRGSVIKNVWISLDVCGLAATGVLQTTTMYLFKNPGSNLTAPIPRTEGTSNEKKHIFKTWNAMTMRNQDGNVPYHWEGWVKIPKRFQRFGTDDRLAIITATTTAAGHSTFNFIYKWFR